MEPRMEPESRGPSSRSRRGREEKSPLLKRRKRVSGDTQEARRGGPSDAYGCQREQGALLFSSTKACIDGSTEMVSFLLEHGANVNQVDSEGWSPLHAAASCSYPDIADLLLQHGASLTAVNCDGCSSGHRSGRNHRVPSSGIHTETGVRPRLADESVEELLEDLSQKQANWRNEQSLLDRQNQQGSTTANAQNKRRRHRRRKMKRRRSRTRPPRPLVSSPPLRHGMPHQRAPTPPTLTAASFRLQSGTRSPSLRGKLALGCCASPAAPHRV